MPRALATVILVASLALAATAAGTRADTGPACVTARCDAPATACVTVAAATLAACLAAVDISHCSDKSFMERARCESDVQGPCRSTERAAEAACVVEARACYASCGPMPEPRVHFWCTGEAGRQPVSFFCEGDLENPTSVVICTEAFAARQLSASLICEGL